VGPAPPLTFLFDFINTPILPSPLSLRERGRGRKGKGKGEYIKCERSFQYIIYILQTPFLLYTPPPSTPPLSERERGEGRPGLTFLFYFINTPILPSPLSLRRERGGGAGKGKGSI